MPCRIFLFTDSRCTQIASSSSPSASGKSTASKTHPVTAQKSVRASTVAPSHLVPLKRKPRSFRSRFKWSIVPITREFCVRANIYMSVQHQRMKAGFQQCKVCVAPLIRCLATHAVEIGLAETQWLECCSRLSAPAQGRTRRWC